ncbi:MAG: ferredoxin [Chloroflexota bacterium]|nr:MAG: ferredoxin [Chloroflexota bacterium]
MANAILVSECISCAACEAECPNGAISSADDTYVIDAVLCDECVATGGDSACKAVCPVDAIVAA